MKEEPAVKVEEKVLDVDASMQGSLTFKDPVNLRINGKFEGSLDTKGSLTIGENAQVRASIVGEDIVICGKVFGNVTSSSSLNLSRSAHLTGDIRTPRLSIDEGAIFQGKCQMDAKDAKVSRSTVQEMLMTVEELAKYLEVDSNSVLDWAQKGRIPAEKQGNGWKFDRVKVDAWIASEKIK
ncbi:MAG: polymer-forming cytoskeletal protein [Candidatus Omnitrophica bacterium]|nr:polymer-forming cytoskeletal protein [Candidatus Omnitrophota bacterium]